MTAPAFLLHQGVRRAAERTPDAPAVIHPKSELSYAQLWAASRKVAGRLQARELKAVKMKADRSAVEVFAKNLRNLLLAAPYGEKAVIGIDPGLRTGCKLALVDKNGAFISSTVMKITGRTAQSG